MATSRHKARQLMTALKQTLDEQANKLQIDPKDVSLNIEVKIEETLGLEDIL